MARKKIAKPHKEEHLLLAQFPVTQREMQRAERNKFAAALGCQSG